MPAAPAGVISRTSRTASSIAPKRACWRSSTLWEAAPAAEMALRYKGLIVGIKTAHYTGPEWTPVEHAVEAGTIAKIPVMVDFGSDRPERPIAELLTKKLRPGDIYTHCYSGLRHELDESGNLNPGMLE